MGQNLFINLALPPLLNRRPERLRVAYRFAWMVIPGEVRVYGLEVWGRGQVDQWRVTADRAAGAIRLAELLEVRLHVVDLRAAGVTLKHHRGPDASPDAAPRPPELRRRWMLRLDGLVAEDVREIQLGELRLTGAALLHADVSLADPYIDVVGWLWTPDMRADIGALPLASGITGDANFLVDCMNRADSGVERLGALHARVTLEAEVEDLRFLDYYLAEVPWLSLSGVGSVALDARVQQGRLVNGSTLEADFPELVVRVARADVAGAGHLAVAVGPGQDGAPETALGVDFDGFTITLDGSSEALVAGTGFQLAARSPDVELDEPFSDVLVEVALPKSRIPDIVQYNSFLPVGIGLSLREGQGTLQGHLVASSLDRSASGELHLAGDDLKIQLDTTVITGDLELHARLAGADLELGRYDLSGSALRLRRVGLVDDAWEDGRDAQRGWSGSLDVTSGVVDVGAPIYLDAELRVSCTDSVPFVRLFTDPQTLPGWAQRRLSVPELSGAARLQLGEDRLIIAPCRIENAHYQLDLRYARAGTQGEGELLVAAGPLAVGVALRPEGPQLQLFGARPWFRKGGGAPPSK